jgi:hypothetical protein
VHWLAIISKTCILYGIVIIIERFWWFWPNALSHRIGTAIFAVYLLICGYYGIHYILAKRATEDIPGISPSRIPLIHVITMIGIFAAAINLIVSASWTWWYPPELNWRMIIMGIMISSWGIVIHYHSDTPGKIK